MAKKNFKPKSKGSKNVESKKLNEISFKDRNTNISVTGLIETVFQTGGPTVFNITDGTTNFALKGFEGAGERAYPEIGEGDVVTAVVEIGEFKDELEGEIEKVQKLDDNKKEAFLKQIKDLQREKAKVTPPEFLVPSKTLDKLKDRFVEAATEIRLAVFQNRPIIVRHHNDADGYSSGFALEKAILPLVEKQHGQGKELWTYFTRAPCSAPFYEIDDSIRDTSKALMGEAKFSEKMPLVIIADNGSSPEDLFAVKQGKVHGIDFIVIDHHFSEEDVISDEVMVHINPFLVGEDGKEFSAGMLCSEIARFINPDAEIAFIPGMAALADRIDNPDIVESYINLADNKGYSKEMLQDIATVIDYVSSKLRFMEAREYVEVLFGEPTDKQKELVKLMAPKINEMKEKGLAIAKEIRTLEELNGKTLQILPIEGSYPRFFYPKPGLASGLLHDFAYNNDSKKIVTIGLLQDMMIFRAAEESGFSVHRFKDYIEKKVPEAFIDGGGHHLAGALRFIPAAKDKCVDALREFIKNECD